MRIRKCVGNVATVEQIAEFHQSIEDIPFKNMGGCLFFCYLFYKWLIKNNFDLRSFDIVQYSYGTYEIVTNQEFIKGNHDVTASSYHFTWMYNGFEYDSCGELNKGTVEGKKRVVLEGLQTRYGSLVIEFCETALSQSSWNVRFNRYNAVKHVRKLGYRIPRKLEHSI